jgi:hypothetical protein
MKMSARISATRSRDLLSPPTFPRSWSQVETIEIGPEQVIIRREGETSDWFRTHFFLLPNACLLKALMETSRTAEG